jgi:hypothetical protein
MLAADEGATVATEAAIWAASEGEAKAAVEAI